MNWSLKGDRHNFTPNSCVHIEVLHLIHRAETISFVSRSRKPSPCAARNLLIYGDCVAKRCQCLRFPSFLSVLSFLDILVRQMSLYLPNLQDTSGVPGLLPSRLVSLYLRPEMHLFPSLRTRRYVTILFASRFPVLDLSVRQGALSIHGLFDAIELFTVEELVETEKARFIVVGFDFATILFSPSCSCILFAIVLTKLVKLKFWAQQRELPSHVKFPFANMSASWRLVSTYLIWNFGSRLIVSNNQSRATLWVLDTCLNVGLLPLMIILITPSLSSKMHSIAPNRENFAFDGTVNIVQIKSVVRGWNLGFVLGVLVWCGVTRQVSLYLTFGVVELAWGRMEPFYNQIPKIKSWNSIHA